MNLNFKLKKDGTKKGSGGSRKGAGRKPNYTGKTKEIGITIPIHEELNVRNVVKEYLSNKKISVMTGYCLICGKEIEVRACCSGRDCGCMGQPIDPPVCNSECYDIWEANRYNGKDNEKIGMQTHVFNPKKQAL